MIGGLAFALQVLQLMPYVTQGIAGAVDAFNWGSTVVKGMVDNNRDPTAAEWDELNARTAALRAALHTD